MIRNILMAVVILFGLFIAGAIAAFYYWGWPGLLGVIGGFVVLMWIVKRFALRIVFWMIARPIRKQAKALKGAEVTVHDITQAEEPEQVESGFEVMKQVFESMRAPPANEWEDDEALEHDGNSDEPEDASQDDEFNYYQGPRVFYYLDLTISPKKRKVSEDQDEALHWKPSAITLSSPTTAESEAARQSPLAEMSGHAFDGSCEMYELQIWRQSAFQDLTPDDFELFGPQRLRIHFGVNPDIEKLTVLYYFEPIGEVRIGTVIDV